MYMFMFGMCLHVYGCSLHLTDTSGCSPCPAGQFCGAAGLTRPSGPCQAGFYCPGGDTTATGGDRILSFYLINEKIISFVLVRPSSNINIMISLLINQCLLMNVVDMLN